MEYLNKWGFSVIPLLPNKKPFASLLPKDENGKPIWEPFQTRRATEDEIKKWWVIQPKALIGVVTGKTSGVAVIDIDTKELPVEFVGCDAPVVETPRGYHLYFKYKDGITNTVDLLLPSGSTIDIRGEGGYVVAPPSVTAENKRYRWIKSLGGGLPKFPMEIMSQPESRFEKPKTTLGGTDETFVEGRRDEDLFSTAHALIKGGMAEKGVRHIVRTMALACGPPFPEKEAQDKVNSAIKRAIRKERPWVVEIKEWVAATSGYFSVTSCYNELQAATKQEKSTIRTNLIRLRDAGVIEVHPRENGKYRRIELECEPINWKDAPTDDMPLIFPLDIHELVRIYSSNIIIVAGESNAGKTAFLLNFIRLNMHKYPIHYFNSEMGASELKIRLGLFKEINEWKFTAWERSDNFIDVIYPNDINVIDFLDITDEFYKVGGIISGIHSKLKKGVALIALQKNFGRDLGRGGALSTEKPRLYLSMGSGQMKIVKAKNWRGKDNPNGLVRKFKLYSGWDFEGIDFWHKEEKVS